MTTNDLIDTHAHDIANWLSKTAADWKEALDRACAAWSFSVDDDPDDDMELEVKRWRIDELIEGLNNYATMMVHHAAAVRRREEKLNNGKGKRTRRKG